MKLGEDQIREATKLRKAIGCSQFEAITALLVAEFDYHEAALLLQRPHGRVEVMIQRLAVRMMTLEAIMETVEGKVTNG